MTGKPKPVFWLFVFLSIAGLIAYALHRAGMIESKSPQTSSPLAEQQATGAEGVLEIKLYSSSAKKKWINAMVQEFNKSRKMTANKLIKIKAWHVTSGGSLDDLKTGKIKPDLWSPGDQSWLRLAASHWQAVKQKALFDDFKPLVNIPLVLAMWEPMARVLGYPAPIGWKDIAAVAANPQGWASLGHPEWGRFRWGHAHPDANSGFLTVISEVYAALGKTKGITPSELKKAEVIAFLKLFEGAVEHYGMSNSWIDKLMHIKGPSYLSATVQYENTIIQTNEKHNNKPFRLVAIYPKEGNFWTRHPIAILKEEWMTAEKEEACQKFVKFLLRSKSQERAMQMGLRPIIEGLTMTAPFDADHGVNPNVNTARKFEVPEDAVLKRIRTLWEDVKIPATVVLLLDRSGSMKGKPMENAKIGGIEFIKNMKHRDQLIINVFNSKVNNLIDLCLIRTCGEKAVLNLETIFADGGTALHDAVLLNYRTLSALKQKDPHRRYSIILLSDGKDTNSKTQRQDFLDALPHGENFNVPKIYCIAYGSGADNDLLAEISNRTNARVFSSSPEEIRKTYKELSANF